MLKRWIEEFQGSLRTLSYKSAQMEAILKQIVKYVALM